MSRCLRFAIVLAAAVLTLGASGEVNLLSLGEGALPVVEPPSYGGSWVAVGLLDDAPTSGWCSAKGQTAGNTFVFELPAPATFTAFEFDTGHIDGSGRGAKDLSVEVSSTVGGGFQKVLQGSLADKKDGQRFVASARVEGRFVRLTVLNNHGDAEWTELMGIRGFAARPQGQPIGDISGTYRTNYNDFHLRQEGTALSGCYDYNEGVFEGAVEGRVMKLTWTETGNRRGPAVFVFAPDGKSFRGYWWSDSDKARAVDGNWDGGRISNQVGSCPHWSGSVSAELRKDLASSGRARLYGILFDIDSARLRSESLPTLDQVVRLLASEPAWRLTIEGHTDSTGAAPHNQTLSEQRAAAVKAYLVAKGVAAPRLVSTGFGQSKPVADNATELGRAQNRRVELVRN